MSSRMLDVKDLAVSYGMITAVKGVSFNLDEGEIVALIGANGAGKSTILRTISGLERAKSGSIQFLGKELTKMPAHKIVEAGIAHVPEGRRVFPRLTVKENLMLGANIVKERSIIQQRLERTYLTFPRLKERQAQLAGTLSGGEQQMLAIARGLMARPKLLLLDEPSMGLAPILVEQIFDIIRDINEQGTSILLVEQNAQMALSIADRGYVLETGRIVLEGTAEELLENPMVVEAYLGGH